MSPGARKLFGIASFLPMLGIFAMVAWLLAHPEMDRVMDFDWSAAKRVSTSTWIQLGVLLGGVTFLQIGMGAVVLSRTKIGRECLVAAGAVVPPGLEVPDRMAVVGVPGKILRPVREEELKYMRWLVPHYVRLAERYTREQDVRPEPGLRREP